MSLFLLLSPLSSFLDAQQHAPFHHKLTRADDIPNRSGFCITAASYETSRSIQLGDKNELPDVRPLPIFLVPQYNSMVRIQKRHFIGGRSPIARAHFDLVAHFQTLPLLVNPI